MGRDDARLLEPLRRSWQWIAVHVPLPAPLFYVGAEVVRKIKEGATFEEMANIYSAPRLARGSVETFRTSSLRKELAEAVSKLKAGEVSDVIETPEVCYIIKVEEARPAHFRSLSEVRDEIERDLKASEQARLERQWIDRLKKKTFVRYF